jgi:hypothetical protein
MELLARTRNQDSTKTLHFYDQFDVAKSAQHLNTLCVCSRHIPDLFKLVAQSMG